MNTVFHHRENECHPAMHSDVPIIEGNETVGVICTICGRSVREDMTRSNLVATEKGLEDSSIRSHHRRDPRF